MELPKEMVEQLAKREAEESVMRLMVESTRTVVVASGNRKERRAEAARRRK